MKVKELMKDFTPKADFEGWVTNDDYVLAINTSKGQCAAGDYDVVQMGVEGLDAQMNPVTTDKQYIRAGQSTQKTGTQRTFTVSGDRYIGDPAQDYMLDHAIKYGTGNSVVVDYVYFNVLNGEGEKGQVSILVNSDGGGNAGESSGIDIELKKIGSLPTAFNYLDYIAGTADTPEPDESTQQGNEQAEENAGLNTEETEE